MEAKTLAAIDIGSNGARLLIKQFDDNAPEFERVKKLMFVRVPLRLGKDVFSIGKISKERMHMMLHMMCGFKEFMEMYGVESYRACATAAMRDAENGKKALRKIEEATDIRLDIIRGDEEARLLCNNLVEGTGSNVGNFAYIDVGGGSTEISLLHDGLLGASHSFNIGTLRLLNDAVSPETREEMKSMLRRCAERFPDTRIIGSGGNINRLYKLAGNGKGVLTIDKLRAVYDELRVLTLEARKEKFKLKDDRADVIIPAAEIFLLAAEALGCKSILVPQISLADSIINGLYQEMKEKTED